MGRLPSLDASPQPFRVPVCRASHALSGACRATVLGFARGGGVCLGSAEEPLGSFAAASTGGNAFGPGFPRCSRRQSGRGVPGLENRQRRKSFVGSNPTPSALFSRGQTWIASEGGGPACRFKYRWITADSGHSFSLIRSERAKLRCRPDAFSRLPPLGRDDSDGSARRA